ncbi:hypothetical protein HHL22_08815 [Hymenobacter sp. RP-2-7]|uniref:Macroglobulin domain-containing protein n=1 Tax=Hymenobacter polaris TaxID=2682546 RepID=A0A7Y0ADD6_9BACT|nr:hypothetical protein [Hymenobacter polaris]NML65303.1 hypothetical protein [Hymenobacter polaris]
MFHLRYFRCFRFALLALLAGSARAQAPAADSLAAALRRYGQQTLVEKLYVHLDRPVYAARETMWLKVYAVDGTFHHPLALSKVAYVEVLNSLHQPVLQTQIALREATGQGSLNLPASLPTGRYVVRAYTSWMKNFDPAFYFHTTVSIINTFTASGPAPAAAQAAGYDVQFFPEGGQLVQGLPSRVAFRVADAAGWGLAATGTVRDGQGRAVATLRTVHAGLGSFELTPAPGATYSAEIQLTGKPAGAYKLPPAAAQGYVLRLTEASPAQLRLRVLARGVGAAAASLALLGHSGQHIATAQATQLNAQGEAEFLIEKATLLAGLSHFTVFDSRRQPVGERLYFRRPRALPLSLGLAPAPVGPRQTVALRLALPAAAATAASASVAVYQLDSLTTGASPADINTFLSLTADLRGAIENPDYYLRDSSQVGQQALDNLLLTHGWSRFRWAEVRAGRPPALPYPPELHGPLVRGQVLTATGAPAPGITAYLAAPSRAPRFYSATSRADGVLQFEPKDWYGPQSVTLQTDWRRDSTYQLALLSPYSARYAPYPAAALELGPALTADLTRRHVQAQLQPTYFGRYAQYELPPQRDTVAFYGVPPVQYRLDDYTRFKVLDEVLREYVQGVDVRPRKDGFHLMMVDKLHNTFFQQDPLVLLDGVPMFNLNKFMAFDPLRIQRVAVFTNRYFYGGQDYEGMLSFTTYRGDLQGFALDPRALLEEYESVQGQREFFAPRYETTQQQQSPLPDQRNLLYWQPAVQLAAGDTQQLTFYTADQAGRYRVMVQALGANGQATSVSAEFEVKPAL